MAVKVLRSDIGRKCQEVYVVPEDICERSICHI